MNFSVHLVSSHVVWIGTVAEAWGTFLPDTILALFLWNSVNMWVYCSGDGACVKNLFTASLTQYSCVQLGLALYALLSGLNLVQSACGES